MPRKAAERAVDGLQRRVGSFIRSSSLPNAQAILSTLAVTHYDRDVS